MREGPDIARVAALVADTARSAMLIALMDGRALTATELAGLAGITKQTASSHLAKLVDGEVLTVEAQGRHRYFRLSGPHVADLIEALMVFSSDAVPPLRIGPRDPSLRKARICYDHLAGEMGVRLFERMQADRWLQDDLTVTERGNDKLAEIGLDFRDLPPRNRPLCRACLDWSQRRQHLAGRLGKAILERLLAQAWARRLPDSRIVSFSRVLKKSAIRNGFLLAVPVGVQRRTVLRRRHACLGSRLAVMLPAAGVVGQGCWRSW